MYRSLILVWLIVSLIFVLIMVVVGGTTRLTDAGLSIVEWKPISGIIPPISNQDWEEVFNQYKSFPEFKLVNNNITISEFKFIFLIEYTHRLLGRITGIVIIVPFLIFYCLGFFTISQCYRLFLISFLVLVQGFIGWYMVKSGLIRDPYVSHYRLAIHLLIAVVIYHLLIVELLNIVNPCQQLEKNTNNVQIVSASKQMNQPSIYFILVRFAYIIFKSRNIHMLLNNIAILLLYVQILFGAFVAGLDAGLIYNSFPNMGNSLLPVELLSESIDFYIFNDAVFIQFFHRWLGIILGIFIICHGFLLVLTKKLLVITGKIMICFILLQIFTGIMTLIFYVPLSLALIHQIGAFMLLTTLLVTRYSLKKE